MTDEDLHQAEPLWWIESQIAEPDGLYGPDFWPHSYLALGMADRYPAWNDVCDWRTEINSAIEAHPAGGTFTVGGGASPDGGTYAVITIICHLQAGGQWKAGPAFAAMAVAALDRNREGRVLDGWYELEHGSYPH